MLGDVKMDDPSAMMGQDQQDEQHLVRHCRHDKEIQGNQVLHVVLQKGLPRWRRRPLRSHATAHVRLATAAYGREQVRRARLADAVEANRRAVALSNELYLRGLGGFLNVLDSQLTTMR